MTNYKCPWGCTSYNPNCDACEGHTNDPDTGWGGFTDHSLGKHFDSEEERIEYLKNKTDDEEDDESYT